MKENAEPEEFKSAIKRIGLKTKCQKIKKKLTKISKIICTKSMPFKNTHFYHRDIDYDPTLLFLSFKDYIYEFEKRTIYVSVMNIFRVI